jgi:mannose-6-phosphate isomerase-like protein (cupin superfamily)
MISHYPDLAVSPEPYADYRPVFETTRLNVTHVQIHPGDTVPAHTHLDEDQVYYVASGAGFVVLDRRQGGGLRADPDGHRARDHEHGD